MRQRTAVLVSALTLAVTAAPPAGAATFAVDRTSDGAAACAPQPPGGPCTLRGAIRGANETPGPDVVVIPAASDPYRLTIAGPGEDANATGDLDVTESLEIRGAGADGVVIDADGLDAAIHGVSGTAALDISGVTITGAPATAGEAVSGNGPRLTLTDVVLRDNHADTTVGAFSNDATDLTLLRVLIAGNTAEDELVEHGPSADGTMHVEATRIEDNTTEDVLIDADPAGGTTTVANVFDTTIARNTASDYGIDVNPSGNVANATLDVRRSVFLDNRLDDSDGLIDFDPSSFGPLAATLRISDTVFQGLRANEGTGVLLIDPSNNAGPLDVDARIERTRFEDNRVGGGAGLDGEGAAIRYAAGSANGGTQLLSIDGSLFRGNQALGEDIDGGAVLLSSIDSPTLVTNSTFVGNRSGSGGTESTGGAIALRDASLDVVNSTFDGNTVAGAGDEDSGGAAIHVSDGVLTVTHSTLTQNTVIAGELEEGPSDEAGGAGLNVREGLSATVTGSIIHGNTAFDAPGDCKGPIQSGGSNIEGGTSCGFTPTRKRAAGQNVGDPGLLPLADNGGPTPTRALSAESPARDAAAAATCPPADQRGVGRPQEAGCDIGAFEHVPGPPPAAPPAGPALPPPGGPGPGATLPPTPLLLQCGRTELALVDVVRSAGRVRITGQAALSLAGRQVDLLVSSRTKRRIRAVRAGRAEVRPDGTFAARVGKPPRRIRSPQYFARAGATRSRALELDRRMYVDRLRRKGERIVLRGHVTKPRPRAGKRVRVFVQTDCRTRSRAATAKLDRRGRFRARFPVPAGVPEILVRAETRVPIRRGRTERTFTLPTPLRLG